VTGSPPKEAKWDPSSSSQDLNQPITTNVPSNNNNNNNNNNRNQLTSSQEQKQSPTEREYVLAKPKQRPNTPVKGFAVS